MNFNRDAFARDIERDIELDEALAYQSGQRVELKSKPGTFDTIVAYDPMMVPSIWLEHDPRPRYPHELRLVPQPWSAVSRFVNVALSCSIAPATAGRIE